MTYQCCKQYKGETKRLSLFQRTYILTLALWTLALLQLTVYQTSLRDTWVIVGLFFHSTSNHTMVSVVFKNFFPLSKADFIRISVKIITTQQVTNRI